MKTIIMKKSLAVAAAASMIGVTGSTVAFALDTSTAKSKPEKKITICHNGNTLTLARPALSGHFEIDANGDPIANRPMPGHAEDKVGPCDPEPTGNPTDDPTTPEPTETETDQPTDEPTEPTATETTTVPTEEPTSPQPTATETATPEPTATATTTPTEEPTTPVPPETTTLPTVPCAPPTTTQPPVVPPKPKPVITKDLVQEDTYRYTSARELRTIKAYAADKKLAYREDKAQWNDSTWRIIERTFTNGKLTSAKVVKAGGNGARAKGSKIVMTWKLGKGATANAPWGVKKNIPQVFVR